MARVLPLGESPLVDEDLGEAGRQELLAQELAVVAVVAAAVDHKELILRDPFSKGRDEAVGFTHGKGDGPLDVPRAEGLPVPGVDDDRFAGVEEFLYLHKPQRKGGGRGCGRCRRRLGGRVRRLLGLDPFPPEDAQEEPVVPGDADHGGYEDDRRHLGGEALHV